MSARALEESPLHLPAQARVVTLGTAPATAGLEHELTGEWRYRIGSFSFTLTTAGGGGVRQVFAQLVDATGTPVYTTPAPGTQASGNTVRYSFAGLVPAFGSTALGAMGGPFYDGPLPDNLTLRAVVASAGGADTITLGRVLLTQRWPLEIG